MKNPPAIFWSMAMVITALIWTVVAIVATTSPLYWFVGGAWAAQLVGWIVAGPIQKRWWF